ELAVAGAARDVADRLLQRGQRLPVGVAHHRHHEPARRADRDAEVDPARLDDVRAVDTRVENRHLAQAVDDRTREQRHEPEIDAVLGAKPFAMARAQRQQLAEVDLVERGEDRGGALRLYQPGRDRPAQLAHRFAIGVRLGDGDAPAVAVGWRGWRTRRLRTRWRLHLSRRLR